jgi:SAM-dependent methyltransferase
MVLEMSRHVRLWELAMGVEGLALLRQLDEGTDEVARRRLAEIRRLLDDDTLLTGDAVCETSPRDGYRAWSESYDDPGNPIIALEQPAVWAFVDSLVPGEALDAACGTDRHARRLVELGQRVLGVDLTPEMLERAARSVPRARFVEGDLCAIPAANASFDLVVCGLALSHVAELRRGVAERGRVLRPGGHLVVSVLHPLQTYLGWHARFTNPTGNEASSASTRTSTPTI